MDYSCDTEPIRRRRGLLLLLALAATAAGSIALLACVLRPQVQSVAVSSQSGLVADLLAKYANDPASVSIQEIKYGPRVREDGHIIQLVFVAFRERNAFGALVYQEQIVKITDDRHASSGPYESAFLPTANMMPWSNNPSGR